MDFNSRYETCGKVTNAIEFTLNFLGSTAVWGYLAIFDFKVSPNLKLAIIVLILFRVLLCFLASLAVYFGLKAELGKILVQFGTDLRSAKSVRQMVEKIHDGDLQLLVMQQLVPLT